MLRDAFCSTQILQNVVEKYLYLILDILTFSIPFLYSFERKRLNFIRFWKPYFTAILSVGLFFIIWDIYFAYKDVWHFNDRYTIGLDLFKLPLEEWLFFLLIPYSSNFIHYSLLYFFPKPQLSEKSAKILTLTLLAIGIGVAAFNLDRIYTLSSFGIFAVVMFLQWRYRFPHFRRYVLSFIIILIPFLLVNGWLTGFFTDEPVVSYNNNENLGIRIGTIPLEDFFYCFSLLYSSVLVFEYLKKENG